MGNHKFMQHLTYLGASSPNWKQVEEEDNDGKDGPWSLFLIVFRRFWIFGILIPNESHLHSSQTPHLLLALCSTVDKDEIQPV